MSDKSAPLPEDDVLRALQRPMAVLRSLADGAQVVARNGVPDADSRAMAERAEAMRVGGVDFEDLVHAAHGHAGLLRFASTDAVRQFTRLFESSPVPVYAHLVIARTALETAAISYWGVEPTIGIDRRDQRYLVLRLRNAEELLRSPAEEHKQAGRESKTKVRAAGAAHRWEVVCNDRRVEVAGISVPSSRQLIMSLVASDQPGTPLEEIGKMAWWYQSGAAHGALYALTESVEPAGDPVLTLSGSDQARILTSSYGVMLQVITLGVGFHALIERHRHMFGWRDPSWSNASAEFGALVRAFVAAQTN